MTRLVIAVCILVWAQVAAAESTPLTLPEVLSAADATHPKLAEADAAIGGKQGAHLAATGAFEPIVKADGQALPWGFYRYLQWSARVEQTLPVGGIKVKTGYRQGLGKIPPYYQERATRDGGEVFASIVAPLLHGRSIDGARAKVRKAKLAVEVERLAREAARLAVARDAALAYWKWVAAGQKVRVARDLITIARRRTERIRAQAQNGALPGVAIVDAERVLWARESAALAAQGKFVEARAKLSLYYRDPQRRPIFASLEQVSNIAIDARAGEPGAGRTPEPTGATTEAQIGAWLAAGVERLPAMRMLALAERQVRVELELADNQRLPTLDAFAFTARDLGPGDAVPSNTDIGVGVSLSVPVFRRKARGNARTARAELAKIAARRRGLRDRVGADVRAGVQALELAGERARLARERQRAAETLAEAERTRLVQGASDLLRVDLRELDAASAARAVIDAQFERRRALTELRYAQGAFPTGAQP